MVMQISQSSGLHPRQLQEQGLRGLEGSHSQDGYLRDAEQVMLDERALSERLGVSRTPIREAIAMLEQDGFVKTVRVAASSWSPTKTEIVDMIAPGLPRKHGRAPDHDHRAQKGHHGAARFFKDFGKDRLPQDHVEEYSKANIAFHQALISLSESPVLVDMTTTSCCTCAATGN